MKTLIIQSYREHDTPAWIGRCLASVKSWAASRFYDYQLTHDEAFELCGSDYLSKVAGDLRAITNLCRLELVRRAHAQGYDRAVWVDADVFVFAPELFSIVHVERYAFARETWVELRAPGRWRAFSAVNNCVFVCRSAEPDLEFLIDATRHVALHRAITSNFQVGGDLIKGLRASLAFETLDCVAMLSNYVVLALATNERSLLAAQARYHGTPVGAANLCASGNYQPRVSQTNAIKALDALERTRGDVLNDWLRAASPHEALPMATEITFAGPDALDFAS